MNKVLPWLKDYFKRADMLLLLMSVAASVFGIVVIYSATLSYETPKYIIVQTLALGLGVGLFMLMTVLDVDILADKWQLLCIFNFLFLALLIFFGQGRDETGNNGWLRFFGIGIQPSEIVKITFIIVLAKQITYLKEYKNLNSVSSAFQIAGHFILTFGYLLFTTEDLGSALVFFFIFVAMLFAAGFKIYWFIIGLAAIAAVTPILWTRVLSDYQKNRIMAPYVPEIDPNNDGVNWHAHQSKIAVGSGQLTGTGLGQGPQSQSDAIYSKESDFIFAVVGEELGMVGCVAVLLILLAIIIRCVVIGIRSRNELSMLVCVGIAAAVTFQTFENIGMCIGLTPVVGITLPFFSYGGSSLFSMFIAMGIVSGVRYRPKPQHFNMYG